ncbi:MULTISPECIES: hypothetical protein [unclassified Pseudodesulfovibrio]|uniref:WD40 repeat domain-containing protein n=1 Tax=unclassified Pseudodesulfovibrio TaxID=2661612 RepID=UPI000FEC032E|nr:MULTISPECIES: hypothetical protein [unclassified Pseudodesulfovibrio]MCJ2165599.1 hypothetical protein [Pseudodesulfovibrio sp. S3-i]
MKRYVVLACAVIALLLCVGCAGKLKNPVVELEGAPTGNCAFYSQMKNEKTLLKDQRVYGVTISSDGRHMAIHQLFKTDMIINPENGWQLALDKGTTFQAFSPDGKALLTSTDEVIRIRALQTGETIHEWGSLDSPRHVSYSSDGKMLAYSTKTSVRVINVEDGKLLFERPMEDCVAFFSPDCQRLAVVTKKNVAGRPFEYITGTIWLLDATVGLFADDELHLYDLASGQTIVDQTLVDSVAVSTQFSHDGRFLALGALKDWETAGFGEIRLYDPASGKTMYSWTAPQELRGIALSPDGNLLTTYSALRGADMMTYDLVNGRKVQQFTSEEAAGIMDATYSPDGRYLAMAIQAYPVGGQGAIVLFDVVNGRVAYSNITQKAIYSVDFFPDGNVLAACSEEGVRLIPLTELQ